MALKFGASSICSVGFFSISLGTLPLVETSYLRLSLKPIQVLVTRRLITRNMLFLPFSHRFLCLFFYWPPFFCTEKEKSLQSTKAVCHWNSPTMKASSWLRAVFLFSTEMDQLKSHPICCLPFAQFVLKPRRKPEIFENWQNIDKNLASSRIAIHQYH